ncbi:amidohydrolase family protein [Streptomyces sp. NBRC 109706]|uniref:amidohydrolase family protein n=1 Tax=Streptomyces sp. NBRC 109706 TaxID=1550035 RepID=UPI0007845C23|nr:amidohydrolase family protein [Streptomyces sp. NBRC 109706]
MTPDELPPLPPLVDQHCHRVLREVPTTVAEFERWLAESPHPPAAGTSYFDSQLGLAVRRWCAPALGLPAYATPDDYLRARTALGAPEAHHRLLAAAGIGTFLVDTGLPAGGAASSDAGGPSNGGGGWTDKRRTGNGSWADDGPGYVDRHPDGRWAAHGGRPSTAATPPRGSNDAAGAWVGVGEMAAGVGGTARVVTRLECLAEAAADRAGQDTDAFLAGLAKAIGAARATSVAFKSVAAYRHGLQLAPEPPSRAELWTAAEHWLLTRPAGGRLRNPVLARHLLWSAVETGLPLQLHTGFGDADLRLHRADPALLTDFVRAVGPTGGPLVLLHCYPFHRRAAHLAAVHPQVHVDLGLTLSHVGTRAGAVLAETLELAPFGKVLFSTDAYGLPELYLVGARQFRQALAEALTQLAAPRAEWPRIAALLAADNARRVYRLD